jgi:hypothetical protein
MERSGVNVQCSVLLCNLPYFPQPLTAARGEKRPTYFAYSISLSAFCLIAIAGIIKITAISTNSKFLKNFIKNLTKHLTLLIIMLKYGSVKYKSNIKSAIK